MIRIRQIGLLLSLLSGLSTAAAEQLSIAVASNFTAPMREIALEFEKATGHQLRISYGSSGKFFAQISHGAPFQVFLSADQAKPAALCDAGLAVPASRFSYAIGALALWSPESNAVDEQGAILRTGNFNKLAIANPLLAPYGRAAVEVLKRLKLDEVTREKWVTGENIAQTYQYVSTGNAEIGFVAVSQVIENGSLKSGSAWLLPSDLYTPIKQDAVLLTSAKDNQVAKAFITYLKGSEAQEIIRAYGYSVAESN
jgi:molybdate transport system substrate-binding protein